MSSDLRISSTNALRFAAGPGGRLPIIESNDTLELKETRETGRLFGIGLKVDMDPPYQVQRVSNIKDQNDHSINDRVNAGDSLVLINGERCVGSMDWSGIETAILGPKNSTVKLGFERMRLSQRNTVENATEFYEVEVKRHVPIKGWDDLHSWIELRQQHQGCYLLAKENIVSVMEELRRCVVDRSNHALDFIREESVSMSSLGMHFQQEMSNESRGLRHNQIHILVPASPAHLSGQLETGDEIVAVDGVRADAANLTKLLRGTDIIGSKCRVTAKRPGNDATFDVELSRTSEFAVSNTAIFVNLVGALERQMKQSVSHETMMPSVQAIFAHFVETERTRCSAEASLADRLFTVQGKIVALINRMESMLRPGEPDQKESKRLKVLVDALKRNLERAFAERDQWKAKQENVTSERDKWKAKHQDVEEKKLAMEQDLDRYKRTADNFQKATPLEEATRKVQSLMHEIDELRKANHEMVNREKNYMETSRHAEQALQSKNTVHKEDAERLQAEVDAMGKELFAIKIKLNQTQHDKDVLQEKMDRMRDTSELHETRSQVSMPQVSVEGLKIELKCAGSQLEELKRELQQKRDEANALRAQMSEMVLCREFLQVKGDLHTAQMEIISKDKEIAGMREQNLKQVLASQSVDKEEVQVKMDELATLQDALSKTRIENQTLRTDMDGLQRTLMDMVPRSQFLAAKTESERRKNHCDAKDIEIESLMKIFGDLKEQADNLRHEFSLLQDELQQHATHPSLQSPPHNGSRSFSFPLINK